MAITLTTNKIENYAPNAAAAKKGRDLVAKSKFSALSISAENNLIWGECKGSGKKPYYCSADFIQEDNPVFRCSCPSRQFPCKHAVGLLYAYEQNASAFATTDVPDDVQSKRSKIEKRQEKKAQEKQSIKEKATKPKRVNTTTLIKKINKQLTGIDLAKKLLNNIVETGLSSVDAKYKQTLKNQTKELGNYYINGIQTAFTTLILELNDVKNENFTKVIDQINYLSTLLNKSTAYLNHRKENPKDNPATDSSIEEQIGRVWKLVELMQYDSYEENAELLQLSFNSTDNYARKEYVDEGFWINLKNAKVYKTLNYRPYKAAKYIKEDNSKFEVMTVKDLYIYPGTKNPRIRWEADGISERTATNTDYKKVVDLATSDYASLFKQIKSEIKSPLNHKQPVAILKLNKTFLSDNNLVIEDENQNKLTLKNSEKSNEASATILKSFIPKKCSEVALLVKFDNDLSKGLLFAQPLSLITPEKVIRLEY